MSSQLESLAAASLSLSSADRATLAQVLLASLDEDEAVDQAWAIETERRLQAIESADMVTLPLAQVLARARQALA